MSKKSVATTATNAQKKPPAAAGGGGQKPKVTTASPPVSNNKGKAGNAAAKPKPKPKPKPPSKQDKVQALVKECASDLEEDWCSFLAEEIVQNIDGIVSIQSLGDLLENHLSDVDDVPTFLQDLFRSLQKAKLITAENHNQNQNDEKKEKAQQSADGEKGERKVEYDSVSEGKLNRVFKKEIDKRQRNNPLEITPEMMKCEHEWYSEGIGGMRCMVCDFETTNRMWGCQKNCNLILCGSCCFKWKNKLT